MNTIKKINCLILIFGVIFLFVTSCKDNVYVKTNVDNINVGQLGPYSEPITITSASSYYITTQTQPGQTANSNVWTDYYKKMGINVKYQFSAPNDQYTQKLNIDIATGNLPDIFTVNAYQLQKLIESGLIYDDLGPIYDKFATEQTKQITEGRNSDLFKAVTVNGKLKAIPWTDSVTDVAEIMYVRKDWLENVGLQPPKTIDELEKVIDAFVNKDPDKNGEKDTYGLVGCKTLLHSGASLNGIFNAFGSYPCIFVEDKPGHINYGAFVEEPTKAALNKLNEWYKKGYINEDFGIVDMQTAAAYVSGDQAGIWFGNMGNIQSMLATPVLNNHKADWLILPVPTASNQPAKVDISSPLRNFHVVSKKCKNPEAIMLLMNAFVNKMWGKNLTTEDQEKHSKMSSFALCQTWPKTKNLDDYKAVTKAIDSKDTSALNAEQKVYYNNVKSFIDAGCKFTNNNQLWDWARYNIFYTGGTQSIIDNYIQNNLIVNNKWCYLDTPDMALKKPAMEDSARQLLIELVMGRIPLGNYDAEMKKILGAGGQDVINEANKVYITKNP